MVSEYTGWENLKAGFELLIGSVKPRYLIPQVAVRVHHLGR
jgi:hypothetical protein